MLLRVDLIRLLNINKKFGCKQENNMKKNKSERSKRNLFSIILERKLANLSKRLYCFLLSAVFIN